MSDVLPPGEVIPPIGTIAGFLERLNRLDLGVNKVCLYLQYAGADGNTVTAETVADEFDISEGAAGDILDWMARLDAVTYPSAMEDAVVVHRERLSRLLAFLERLEGAITTRQQRLLANAPLDEVEVTITTPAGWSAGETDLLPRLEELVMDADSSLVMVTPFFTEFGIDKFVTRLAQRAADGVTVDVITRDTDEGDAEEAVRRLEAAAVEIGGGALENISVYDYGTATERLHAKALVADGERAYIGSANLTSYSLQEAIEIGVIVDGPVVDDINAFLTEVRELDATELVL
jgi:phosphatidylserine/phosphatidylglycerophosphate/cardiolipin synthase-like enzyme